MFSMACEAASSVSRACSTAGVPSGFLSIRWTMQWRIGMGLGLQVSRRGGWLLGCWRGQHGTDLQNVRRVYLSRGFSPSVSALCQAVNGLGDASLSSVNDGKMLAINAYIRR